MVYVMCLSGERASEWRRMTGNRLLKCAPHWRKWIHTHTHTATMAEHMHNNTKSNNSASLIALVPQQQWTFSLELGAGRLPGADNVNCKFLKNYRLIVQPLDSLKAVIHHIEYIASSVCSRKQELYMRPPVRSPVCSMRSSQFRAELASAAIQTETTRNLPPFFGIGSNFVYYRNNVCSI